MRGPTLTLSQRERVPAKSSNVVIAGLDPAIHLVTVTHELAATEWMPWLSHGMTTLVGPVDRLTAVRWN